MAMDGVAGYALGSIAFFFFWVLAVFPNFPVLPIGRTSGALLGAALMVVFQIISPHEAYESLDLPILGLLFGTMVVSVYVESVGLFQHLGDLLSWGAPGPKSLLCRLCILVAITSALFTNDTVCVAMTGFVLRLCREKRLPPEPFLLALATSANIGSAATPIGNPQNLVIAVEGKISFGKFSQEMLPSVTIGFFLNTIMLLLVYWKTLSATLPSLPLPLEGEQTHIPTAPENPLDVQTKNDNDYVYDYDYDGSFSNPGRVERARDFKIRSSQPHGDSSILKSLSRRTSKDFEKSSRFSITEKNKKTADNNGEENELNSEKIEMLKQSSLKSDDSILSFDNLLKERSQDFKLCSSQPQGDSGILKSLSTRTSKDFDRSSRFSIIEKKNKTADISIVEPTIHGDESQLNLEKVVVEMSKQPSLKSNDSILSEKSIGHFVYKGNGEAKYVTGSVERPQPFPVACYDSVPRSTFIEEVDTISKTRLRLFKKIYVILVTLGMLAALLYGLDMSWSAITAAVVLMVLDFKDSGPSLDKVSYSLLVFFSGMFIVVDGFNRTEIPGLLWSKVEPLARIDSITGVMMLTVVIIILSNVASNVPTVLLLGPQVVASAIALKADPTQAWLILAWVSTIAGNLTLLGSASNLIISEQAKRDNSSPGNLSCTRHLRFGPLSTCIVTFVGLPLIHWPRL